MERLAIIFTVSILLSGCAGYSMHTMYEVDISVSDYKTDTAISGATITIKYDYDSYGWFYFANTPKDMSGITNENGILSTKLADYRYRILMWVNGIPVGDIDKELVQNGGKLLASPNESKYRIVVSPR